MGYVGQDYMEGVFKPDDLSVASGTTSGVIDLGQYTSFVPWFAGAASMLPCDSTGAALPSATAIGLTTGTVTDRLSRYAKFSATGGAMVVCRI